MFCILDWDQALRSAELTEATMQMAHNKYSRHTYSYLALRKAIGWIGLLLPFVLISGEYLIFGGDRVYRSISFYYHSGMRDVLVGALCAVALFMFFYSGYDKLDNWAGNFAGFMALGVAWFPTTEEGPVDLVGKIHLAFAILFFLSIAFYSLFLFTRKGPDPTPQKLTRNVIHTVCGLIIFLSLLVMLGYFIFREGEGDGSSFLFWGETVALLAFGVSWLTKGGSLIPDKQAPVPSGHPLPPSSESH